MQQSWQLSHVQSGARQDAEPRALDRCNTDRWCWDYSLSISFKLAFIPLVQCQSTSPAWYYFINGQYLLWVPQSTEDKVEVETPLMGEHRHDTTSLLISSETDAYISSISSASATLHRGTKSWRWAERPAVTSFRDTATQLGLVCVFLG